MITGNASRPERSPRDRRLDDPDGADSLLKRSLVPAVLCLAVAAAYSNTLNGSFHFDDLSLQDGRIRIEALSWERIKPILFSYRPAPFLSFALNFYLGGPSTFSFHLVNLLIHGINAILVYGLFRKILARIRGGEGAPLFTQSDRNVALFASLLWALHPVQTEAVTYIIQRITLMAALFSFLALYSYDLGRDRHGIRALPYYGISLLSILLAFATKENTLAVPPVIALYELFFIRKLRIAFSRESILPAALTALLVIVSGIVLLKIHGGSLPEIRAFLSADYGAGRMDPLYRTITESRVLVYYLSLLAFPEPSRLNLDYEMPMSRSIFDPPQTAFSLILVAALLIFAIRSARKFPLPAFAVIWYFILLGIESTVIPLDLIFEHRLYLPSVMLFLPVTSALWAAVERFGLKSGVAGLIFLAGLALWMTAWTWERNRVWTTEVSLWSDVVSKSPGKARGHYNLGKAYAEAGNADFAIREYREAAKINPRFPDPHFNLGDLYLHLNRDGLAIEEFETFVRLMQDDTIYLSEARTKLGILKMRTGRGGEARFDFEEGVRLNPRSAFSQYNAAVYLEMAGDFRAARAHYEEALKWIVPKGAVTAEMIRMRLAAPAFNP